MMRYLPFIIISLILYTLFFYHNQEPALLSASADVNEQKIKEKVIPLDLKIVDELAKQSILEKQQAEKSSARKVTTNVEQVLAQPLLEEQQTEEKVVAQIATDTEQLAAQPLLEKQQAEETIDAELTDTQAAIATSNVKLATAAQKTVSLPSAKSVKDLHSTMQLPAENKIKEFKAAISATPASETALLKGEFYERDFHLDLPAPPVAKQDQIEIESLNAQNPQLIQTSTDITEQRELDSLSSELLQQNGNIITQQTTTTLAHEKPKRIFKKPLKKQQTATIPGLQVAIAVSGNTPTYPQQAKADKIEGTVTAKFIVNMQGKSKKPEIIISSGYKMLDQALLDFIAKERFMPALKGIEKITSEQQFTFKYQYQ